MNMRTLYRMRHARDKPVYQGRNQVKNPTDYGVICWNDVWEHNIRSFQDQILLRMKFTKRQVFEYTQLYLQKK